MIRPHLIMLEFEATDEQAEDWFELLSDQAHDEESGLTDPSVSLSKGWEWEGDTTPKDDAPRDGALRVVRQTDMKGRVRFQAQRFVGVYGEWHPPARGEKEHVP